MLESKLRTETFETKRLHSVSLEFSLFRMSQCVAYSQARWIFYHVIVSCKGPIQPLRWWKLRIWSPKANFPELSELRLLISVCFPSVCSLLGHLYTNIRLNELGQTFVVRLGTKRIMRLDELPFVVRRSRGTTEDSSSRRIMRLVLVFILGTHNPTNNKCLPNFVLTDNAFSSIKTVYWQKSLKTFASLHFQCDSLPNIFLYFLGQCGDVCDDGENKNVYIP